MVAGMSPVENLLVVALVFAAATLLAALAVALAFVAYERWVERRRRRR